VAHAHGFAVVAEEEFGGVPPSFLDLGSGGGLPGLVLLDRWRVPGALLDSSQRRCAFLREVLSWPDSPAGATVLEGRAEDLARRVDLREAFPLVTARSFGPPAVTAECASAFVSVGGVLIVSEPPGTQGSERWPATSMARLGLEPRGLRRRSAGFQVIAKVSPSPDAYPRAVGVPGRRPLF
jgi:16S rRNA (guanine527-N7)-methyltransferase